MVKGRLVIHLKKSYYLMILGLRFFCMAADGFYSQFVCLKNYQKCTVKNNC